MESELETQAPDQTLGATRDLSAEGADLLALDRGASIGRYLVLGRLGSGGMGVVYAAYDPELDRKIALKLLHVDGGGSQASQGRRRLLAEAQAMAKLSHPNVISVHDVGEHAGSVFVAMEFVDGLTLGEHLAANPGDWSHRLELFEAAARGLAAAHAKGLVHRDFKPDNCMVGRDGRVRVLDFGLARPIGATSAGATHSDGATPRTRPTHDPDGAIAELNKLAMAETAASPGAERLVSLTRAGAIVGTPAYMSPEQWLGEEAGAPADQFSFCVALWESLFGERPFEADSVLALSVAVIEGKRKSPPANNAAPRWLTRVLERGLAVRPEDRFADMPALMAALAAGRASRSRQRWMLAGVGVLTLGAGAYGYLQFEEAQRVQGCEDEAGQIATIWDDARRTKVREGLLASGARQAADTAERVIPRLDSWAQTWAATRRETCRAADVERRWDANMRARADQCLGERLMEFESLVDMLETADDTTALKSVAAVSSTRWSKPCSDERYLALRPMIPEASIPAAQEVGRKMARSEKMASAGKFTEARELAQEALPAAEALEYPPLLAGMKLALGAAQVGEGKYEPAEVTLTEAYLMASKANASEVAGAAAIALVQLVGSYRAKPQQGLVWAKAAEAAVSVVEPEAGHLSASLKARQAGVLEKLGDNEGARALHEESIALYEREYGAEHPDTLIETAALAAVMRKLGDNASARAIYERVLPTFEATLGPDHPYVAMVMGNYSMLFMDTGEFEEGKKVQRKVVATLERAYGPQHPSVGQALNMLAGMQYNSGDFEGAADTMRRCLSITEKAMGPEHAQVASHLDNLGMVVKQLGDLEEAERLQRRALKIVMQERGLEHHHTALTLSNLGTTLDEQGKLDESIELFNKALAIHEKVDGPESIAVGTVLTALGRAASQQGDHRGALAHYERALQTFEGKEGAVHQKLEASFGHARAQYASSRSPKAREAAVQEAKRTAESYRGMGEGMKARVAEIETWLTGKG